MVRAHRFLRCFHCERRFTEREIMRGDYGVFCDELGFLRLVCYDHPVVGNPYYGRRLFLGDVNALP